MLQTLVLAAAMSFAPAQGSLDLTNARITFGGMFGPERPNNKFLPGDVFFMVFDIEGLRPDAQGTVAYTMHMVVTNAMGKILFENKPEVSRAQCPLGASPLPARAYVELGDGLKGTCTCKITVTDQANGASKSVEKSFEVVDANFGIVGFRTSYDDEDKWPAPMKGIAGQVIYLHFATVEFARDQTSKQPSNQVEMRVYDRATNKPTTEQPLVFAVKENVKQDITHIDWTLPLPLNRPGEYMVELTATDTISKKSYKMKFPVSVMPAVK